MIGGYAHSRLALRMSVLIRMNDRGMTRQELADATGLTALTVLEAYLHTPEQLKRLAVALSWPPDHFADPTALRSHVRSRLA
jgi:hypothetical protein